MTTKSHNAKKPKLADHHSGAAQDQAPSAQPGDPQAGEGATPEKHKMSFAQHQHELENANAAPPPEPPPRHLKSDAQQHQQKSESHHK